MNTRSWKQLTKEMLRFDSDKGQLRLSSLNWIKEDSSGNRMFSLLSDYVRNHSLIDFIIKKYVSKPPKQLLRAVLSIGILQILELEQAPTRRPKAVHHSVELARMLCSQGESRFVNAVLRRIAESLDETLSSLDHAPQWSIRFSHPKWLVERWIKHFGQPKTRALLSWNQQIPRHYVHDFTRSLPNSDYSATLEPLGLAHTAWNDFYRIEKRFSEVSEMLLDKPFYVQDPSTRIAPGLLGERIKGPVLDACAAPGGKAVHLIKALNKADKIVAADVSEQRLRVMQENLDRLNIKNIETVAHDWTDTTAPPAPFGLFASVFVDVPCSSCGIIQKHPEIRWRLSDKDFELMSKIQLDILNQVSQSVAAGGKLVYSTCSLDPEENTNVAQAFVQGEYGNEFVLLESQEAFPPECDHDGVGAFLFQRSG